MDRREFEGQQAAAKARFERRQRLLALHALAAYLVEDEGSVSWSSKSVPLEGTITGAPATLRFDIEVEYTRFWRHWAEACRRKGVEP